MKGVSIRLAFQDQDWPLQFEVFVESKIDNSFSNEMASKAIVLESFVQDVKDQVADVNYIPPTLYWPNRCFRVVFEVYDRKDELLVVQPMTILDRKLGKLNKNSDEDGVTWELYDDVSKDFMSLLSWKNKVNEHNSSNALYDGDDMCVDIGNK
ncbi:hypothetical protein Tco_0669079 [Tanacetum coccineum]